MTRSQIEYILTLGKLKHFGQAAEACYITQSTLSAMVAKFEEQSGVEIFNRRTRPLSITPQGLIILKSLKSIYREFLLLDEQLNELKGIEAKQLSIACIPTVAPYLYPLILNKISQKHQKIELNIYELQTEQIIKEILDGNLDFGIVSIPLDNKELLEYLLYEEDFLIYDRVNKENKGGYKIADIDISRLWLLEEGHCLRNQIARICDLRQQKKINGNLIYSCGSIFTLIEMVKINKGITLLPRLSLVKNKQTENKYIYEISPPIPSRSIGLICHKNSVKKRVKLDLINIIQSAVEKHLPKSNSERSVIKPFA